MISYGGGYQPKKRGAPDKPPANPPNKGSAGKKDPKDNLLRVGGREVRIDAGEVSRAVYERMVEDRYRRASALPRPTEPEGAEEALARFLANWRNRRAPGAGGDRARADLWHSIANVPVELLREMGCPAPKVAGKALLVLVPLGIFCAALALVAAIGLAVLVAL